MERMVMSELTWRRVHTHLKRQDLWSSVKSVITWPSHLFHNDEALHWAGSEHGNLYNKTNTIHVMFGHQRQIWTPILSDSSLWNESWVPCKLKTLTVSSGLSLLLSLAFSFGATEMSITTKSISSPTLSFFSCPSDGFFLPPPILLIS